MTLIEKKKSVKENFQAIAFDDAVAFCQQQSNLTRLITVDCTVKAVGLHVWVEGEDCRLIVNRGADGLFLNVGKQGFGYSITTNGKAFVDEMASVIKYTFGVEGTTGTFGLTFRK